MSPHTDPGALLKRTPEQSFDGLILEADWADMHGGLHHDDNCEVCRDIANVRAAIRQAASQGNAGGEKQASDAPVWYAHAEAHAWADGYNAALSPPVKTGGEATNGARANDPGCCMGLAPEDQCECFESALPKLTAVGEIKKANYAIAKWLSAALEDPAVCEAMKADINTWFEAHEPWPDAPLHCQCVACQRDQYPHASDCAVHNGPALPVGGCTCRGAAQASPDYRQELENARQEIVLAIAFLGRDIATKRLDITATQLCTRLANADARIRGTLAHPSASRGTEA